MVVEIKWVKRKVRTQKLNSRMLKCDKIDEFMKWVNKRDGVSTVSKEKLREYEELYKKIRRRRYKMGGL